MRLAQISLVLFSLSILLISLFYLQASLSAVGSLSLNQAKSPPPPVESEPSAAGTEYAGTILKTDDLNANLAPHRLVDKTGKTLAYLQSPKIDLRILEGSTVRLNGGVKKMTAENIPLLLVEKVSFK